MSRFWFGFLNSETAFQEPQVATDGSGPLHSRRGQAKGLLAKLRLETESTSEVPVNKCALDSEHSHLIVRSRQVLNEIPIRSPSLFMLR